jgi:hypothetical protein
MQTHLILCYSVALPRSLCVGANLSVAQSNPSFTKDDLPVAKLSQAGACSYMGRDGQEGTHKCQNK